MLVHLFNIGQSKAAAAHAGLVGDNEEVETGALQSLQRHSRARKNHDLLDPAEVVLFLEKRSMAVEKDSDVHLPTECNARRETCYGSDLDVMLGGGPMPVETAEL